MLLPIPFVVYLVVVGGWLSDVILAISLFAVVAYSLKGLRFKERPFLDSLTSSTHFVSPAVFGLALAAVVSPGVRPTWPLVALLIAYFLWGAASYLLLRTLGLPDAAQLFLGAIAYAVVVVIVLRLFHREIATRSFGRLIRMRGKGRGGPSSPSGSKPNAMAG